MKINTTLHCHGAWTDYASRRFDIERFPRSVEKLADVVIEKGLDLVGLTDISGSHVSEIYLPLISQKGNKYILEPGEISSVLTRKEDGRQLVFARSLEVLSKDAHVLAVGTFANILGARSLGRVMDEIYEKGGKAIADHPCYILKFGKGMGEERVRQFREEGKLIALEENANIVKLLERIGQYNQKAINLGVELDIPVIANCDGNISGDIGIMHTRYEIPDNTLASSWYSEIISLLENAKFNDSRIKRKGRVKKFRALPLHFGRGIYSIVRGKLGWIERGLPAC